MRRLIATHASTLALAIVAAALLAVGPYAFLSMAPALGLAWLVIAGRFTGERAIAWTRRVATRLRRVRVMPPVATTPPPTPWLGLRGGLLLAGSLASRPPPAG